MSASAAVVTFSGPLASLSAAAVALWVLLASSAAASAAQESAPGYRALAFPAPKPGSYELPPLGEAADGALLDDDGKPARLFDLYRDKIVVLSFVYTHCRETNGCPLASFVLAGLQTVLLERPAIASSVRLVTVSFDPQSDPPARMREYGERLRKAPVDWRFLTTRSEREITPVLDAYGQSVRKDYDADGRYLGTFSHVLRVYLIDRSRRIRNIYSTSFLHADTLFADVETLLAESSANAASDAPTTAPSMASAPTAAEGALPVARESASSDSPARPTDSLRPDPQTAGSPASSQAMASSANLQAPASPANARLGLPPVPEPPEGPATPRQIALGRKLFFDRRLSSNETFSCAMCHVPEQGFANNEMATAVGVEGRTVKRNAPTVLNTAYAPVLFFDGRASTLEEQAWGPLLAFNEMANASDAAVVAKIESLPDYADLFRRAYGTGPSRETIGRALASYERTLIAGSSRFDRWRFGGEASALSDEEQRGFALFDGKAGCSYCHQLGAEQALLSDYGFHDTGIAQRSAKLAARPALTFEGAPGEPISFDRAVIAEASETPPSDEGRFEATHDPADRYKFRTPSLRNVALTAPYMHDGSFATLEQVVRYYAAGGEPHDGLDPHLRPLGLDDGEISAVVAFLFSLTGETEALVADTLHASGGAPRP